MEKSAARYESPQATSTRGDRSKSDHATEALTLRRAAEGRFEPGQVRRDSEVICVRFHT
jgi:hypothetical protein